MGQLPRLGKRELICLLLFTCNYVVSVWRGFLSLWVLGMGYVILLWHSLSLPYNYLVIAFFPFATQTDISYDSTIPLLFESKIEGIYPPFVVAQPGICQTWSETPLTGFLMIMTHSCTCRNASHSPIFSAHLSRRLKVSL